MMRSQDWRDDNTEDPFNQGVDNTLRLLRQIAPLDTWMLTRVEGNDQIVVRADDHGYGIEAGTVFDWSGSFCIRMLEGRAPRITPDAASEPAYAEALKALAAAGDETPISSYIGYPVRDMDHQLYGVLCAIQPGKNGYLARRAGRTDPGGGRRARGPATNAPPDRLARTRTRSPCSRGTHRYP